jgi:spore coat protein CotH
MRLPLNWRRHWQLVAAAGTISAVLAFALGGMRVSAANSSRGGEVSGIDIAGTVDLFDSSVIHTLEVSFDPAEYEGVINTFAQDGEKEYIQADAVVDGTLVESVGIRLKGNSTLFGLAGNDESGGRQVPALGGSGMASAENPEFLPWLIDFDQFVDDRTYQGHEEIAVRPGGMGVTQVTALNEALSLTLIDLAGEPAEAASYAAFSVNGSEPTLRLLVQHPDDSFSAADLEDEGVLYKALSGTDGGSFTYEGEDPLAYAGSFRQVTKRNSQDLAPLIEFIRWVEESSDQEFAAGLEERVDVESFARYLALHNLLLDSDDMSGPGQNYYLFYDLETERFRVVTWDANATFSGDAGRGPYDDGRIGGPGAAGQAGLPGGVQLPADGGWQQGDQGPAGPPRPGGGANPPGPLPAGPGEADGAPAPGNPVRPPAGQGNLASEMGGHLLKERFLAEPEFRARYEEIYRTLYRQLFIEGAGLDALDEWAAVLATAEGGLVDPATLANEVAQLRGILEARTAALASNEVISG